MPPDPVPVGPGLVKSRRSTPSVLAALLRDPLSALPPEVYTAPIVEALFAGRRRLYLLDPPLI